MLFCCVFCNQIDIFIIRSCYFLSSLVFSFLSLSCFCILLVRIVLMALSMVSVALISFGVLFSFGFGAASAAAVCADDASVFLYGLRSQCPLSISPNPPLEVDGNFVDRVLTSKQGSSFTSVLFYASWCPFSHDMRSKFEMLASMFPKIEHFAVEQSSVLPSVFSRYGIHGLPSILIANQTLKVRYHGPKNLQSLIQFYEKTTGLEPVQYITDDKSINMGFQEKSIMQRWEVSFLEEMMKREPYLAFAVLFLCVRVLLLLSPKVVSHLKALWGLCILHFNLEILGETSQLFGRILHMIDVRRIWTKLRWCKTRNFHERAKNCRVWASSLASVSLGKSSSSARS